MWLTKTKYNQLLPTIPHTVYAQNELGYHTAVTCPWMLWFWWTNLSCSKATRPCGPSIKSPQSALLASKISSEFRSVAALRLSTSWAWRSCWTGRRWLHGDVWLTVHVICCRICWQWRHANGVPGKGWVTAKLLVNQPRKEEEEGGYLTIKFHAIGDSSPPIPR